MSNDARVSNTRHLRTVQRLNWEKKNEIINVVDAHTFDFIMQADFLLLLSAVVMLARFVVLMGILVKGRNCCEVSPILQKVHLIIYDTIEFNHKDHFFVVSGDVMQQAVTGRGTYLMTSTRDGLIHSDDVDIHERISLAYKFLNSLRPDSYMPFSANFFPRFQLFQHQYLHIKIYEFLLSAKIASHT